MGGRHGIGGKQLARRLSVFSPAARTLSLRAPPARISHHREAREYAPSLSCESRVVSWTSYENEGVIVYDADRGAPHSAARGKEAVWATARVCRAPAAISGRPPRGPPASDWVAGGRDGLRDGPMRWQALRHPLRSRQSLNWTRRAEEGPEAAGKASPCGTAADSDSNSKRARQLGSHGSTAAF